MAKSVILGPDGRPIDVPKLCGYAPDPEKVESVINDPYHRHPIFDVAAHNVIRTYERKDTHLWIPLLWLLPNWKRGAQGIGDCTSWGKAGALTVLLAKIFYKLQILEGFSEVATESSYGLGRVEVRGGRLGGYSDGCSGAAMADAASKWGCVLRRDYSKETGNPEHDMRVYDAKKAKEWGNFGCGGKNDKGALDKIARLQIVKTVSRCGGFEDAAAAIAGSLLPVTNASMYGTDMKRDKYGQCKWNGSWSHMQFWLAVRFGKYPGLLKMQSWGPKVVSGPMGDEFTENLPPGGTPEAIAGCCWWQPAEDVDRECRSGDCWVYGDLPDYELDKTDFSQVFGRTKPRSSRQKTTVAI